MNTTVNGSSCSSPANATAQKIWTTIAHCLILVVSLVGNSFICIIVYKTKTMRKPNNFFIVNMAMSDLLFPIFLFPWILANMYADSWLVTGPLGQALCKLSWFLPNVSTVISIQSLILVAVDRFGAVVFPLRSPLIGTKLCKLVILTTWIVGMALCSPYLFAVKLVKNAGKISCLLRWNEAFGESSSFANYLLSIYVVILYIPYALLAILYSIILYKLKSQKIPGELSVSAENQRIERNNSVLKMAIAIVLVFVICCTPISIINLLTFFAWNNEWSCGILFYIFSTISSFIAKANCAINPWICFIFSENYRQGLRRLLKCCEA